MKCLSRGVKLTRSLIYFWRGVAKRGGRFDIFFRPKFPRGQNEPQFLRNRELKCIKFQSTYITVIDAVLVCFRFQTHCFVLETDRLKVQI